MENENNDAVRAEPIGNPWREFIENCIGGGNYFRTSEWHALLADLDRLYAKSAAHAAQSEALASQALRVAELESAISKHLDPSWECNSDHPALAAVMRKLAQQPGDAALNPVEPKALAQSIAELDEFLCGACDDPLTPSQGESISLVLHELKRLRADSRRPAAAPTDANRYACNLATAIWEKHYKADAPQWQVLPDTYGALSQIDNMVTGLSRAAIAAARPSAAPEAIRLKVDYTGDRERGWIEVIGEEFTIECAKGHRFAIHNSLEYVGEYAATHIATGFAVGRGETPEAAIELARTRWATSDPESLSLKLMRAKNLTKVDKDRLGGTFRLRPAPDRSAT